ncbi:MAG: thiol:disulfide oxidoreductase [Rhodospirillaceae bacterium TMED8]|nr:thiol:disulfide oxidoreductase [Magnetovibrio sp.]OUT53203.1 MAG: thiol:disulfide oxidoreductase [Rhodospirillaceae bacterium TMED8]
MIDFYYWPTPNGWKVAIMLEELGIPYDVIALNILKGDQFDPEFLVINPNHRMPAIVDNDAEDNPVTVFESGAIMIYLAEKFKKFMPTNPLGRKEVLEWVFWQVGNLGPMGGQHSHFFNYTQKNEVYSEMRYKNEYNRCIGVLERRLENREYLASGEYTIADMICWPWVLIAKALGQPLDEFPNVTRWRAKVKSRPAVQRAVNLHKEWRRHRPPSLEERKIMFNQTARTANEVG